jgi:hypothetical protein
MGQPKRLKERNGELVNRLPCWSASLSFKLFKNSAVCQQKSQASAVDNTLEPITPTEGVIRVACEEGTGRITLFGGSAGEGFLWVDES